MELGVPVAATFRYKMTVYFICLVQSATGHWDRSKDPAWLLNTHEQVFQFSQLLPVKNIRTSVFIRYLEKTADILRRHHWDPCEMTFEKRAQKSHTNDALLTRSEWCVSLVAPRGKSTSTNQKHHPDLSSDTSSEWNCCSYFSVVISGGKQWRRGHVLAAKCIWQRQRA